MARWNPFGRREQDDRPLESLRFVVVDTELTSLDQRTNRLLAVGAIAMQGARILIGEQFYRVVNPGVPVPKETVVIHRLRPTDVEQGVALADALKELSDFFRDSVLVAHCAEIDRAVLRKEFLACGLTLGNAIVCTARTQRWLVKRQPYKEDQFRDLENTDLESLARAYNLDFREAHHALDDAFVTAQLWQKHLHALSGFGVNTLGELLRIARP
ncbi:MAG TPA: 3'-5' exonuclease [Candidatus Acidoferrales bacterium]|nr:3'-5' exonuclease [Candidatus Acidoferrales bacterium]